MGSESMHSPLVTILLLCCDLILNVQIVFLNKLCVSVSWAIDPYSKKAQLCLGQWCSSAVVVQAINTYITIKFSFSFAYFSKFKFSV